LSVILSVILSVQFPRTDVSNKCRCLNEQLVPLAYGKLQDWHHECCSTSTKNNLVDCLCCRKLQNPGASLSGDSCRQEYWDGTVAGEPGSEAAELVGLGKELKEAYMLSDIRLKHAFTSVPYAFCSIGARNDGSDFSDNFSSL
jgi:hypothetical protein